MEADNYVTIRQYRDHILGEIVINALHSAGIQTFRLESSHSMFPSENLDIKVHKSQVEAAIEIIEATENF